MPGKRRNQIVPASRSMLQEMKYEIAAELGLPVHNPYYTGSVNGLAADSEFAGELGSVGETGAGTVEWRHLTSRQNGAVGGAITQRLIRSAESELSKFGLM
ncbi:alpha/beta-type small acid-soluble spore protein [Paenibacillus sp. P96]|uniref:Alpha/beta-type small acid-soluble spore protein n=1 Tax=Paenibacillus zeirhizosphaerae TaxID=2987519 RepID=A0ABT9FMX1_9BACL|nr:alpha/beta-type small acid-soluble spore protein [Paenibacillus sp. P96]MDP4096066.1 alpha/beta-type small acid-soluble spore protein [Paenibacillus sp. P96]